MISFTALTTLCFVVAGALAQREHLRELLFNTTPYLSSNGRTSQSSLPIFASIGSSSREAPSFESRQSVQSSNVNQAGQVFGASSRQAPPFESRQSDQSSNVNQAGPPVFASFAVPTGAPFYNVTTQEDNLQQLSKGAEKFTLEFLVKISNEHLAVPRRSYMVSPLSVWSLLMLLTEGAQDHTLYELRQVLNLENKSATALRAAYRDITRRLNAKTTSVEVASYQALFTDINKPLKRDYENIVEREYQSVLTPVDFADVNNTFVRINQDISAATRGLLPHSVLPQDLIDVKLLMISSLYFKGKWKYPFESGLTRPVPFHDEFGNVTGNVEMMTQIGEFTYTLMRELDSHILELPYGESNRMSMLIIWPKKGVTLNSVMRSLPRIGVSAILQQLDEEVRLALREDTLQDVEVFLPKFTTQSHFSIRYILETMGLIDIFQPAYANLSNIANDVYVSSIFQSTRIIVNEEGTEAAAVASASLANKASPARFYIDRPFAYMIVEKTVNLVLFAGEIKSHM